MNPFDFVKASGGGDSLMPIVIFVIWIALSFFSNAQKKKKKVEQQKAREAWRAPEPTPERVPAGPETMTQNEEKRAPVYDEIRHEQESVLQNSSQAEERSVTPEIQEPEEQSYEAPVAPVVIPSVKITPAPPIPPAFTLNVYDTTMAEAIASSPITDIFSAESQEKSAVQLTVTHEAVRSGFVWSVILGAPKTLEDACKGAR